MYKLRVPCTRNVGYFLGMYVLSQYHTFFCLDISFVISNEIVIVCFKICTAVHKTAKLKVIRKDVRPKAVDKTIATLPIAALWSPRLVGCLCRCLVLGLLFLEHTYMFELNHIERTHKMLH